MQRERTAWSREMKRSKQYQRASTIGPQPVVAPSKRRILCHDYPPVDSSRVPPHEKPRYSAVVSHGLEPAATQHYRAAQCLLHGAPVAAGLKKHRKFGVHMHRVRKHQEAGRSCHLYASTQKQCKHTRTESDRQVQVALCWRSRVYPLARVSKRVSWQWNALPAPTTTAVRA